MSLESTPTDSPPSTAFFPVKRRLGWIYAALLLLFVLLLAYAAYNLINKQDQHASRVETALTLLQQSRQELLHLQAEFDAVRAQAVIEESTRKALEVTLAETQVELLRAQEQLAFYDQLMPAGPSGALSLRALDITPQDGQLYYRVLLQRNAQQAGSFSGRLEFEASGQQANQGRVTLILKPVAGETESVEPAPDILGLGFERFQRSAGWLQIPTGFEPQSVTLKVFEGNVLRLTRKIELDAVLKP